MKNKKKYIPNYRHILGAKERITPFIIETPILKSEWIDKFTNCSIYFKCENLQKTGSFKIRGATNALLNYFDQAKEFGVVTHSSGNFGKALAYISNKLGVKAVVIMPRNAPTSKINGVLEYNAEVIFCEPTLSARQKALEEFLRFEKFVFIPPYDNPHIIAGQGTAAIELFSYLDKITQLDYLIAPVGGGGLISGTAIASKFLSPGTIIIAGEPEGADDAYRSIREGKILPSQNPKTIADGLLTSLSELTFSLIRNNVDKILTVKEESIISAMKIMWNELKVIVEPSAAVAFAVVLQYYKMFTGSKIGIIISGGNVDLDNIPF